MSEGEFCFQFSWSRLARAGGAACATLALLLAPSCQTGELDAAACIDCAIDFRFPVAKISTDQWTGGPGIACSAVVIAPRVLATAAHCLEGVPSWASVQARFSDGTSMTATGWSMHPHYYFGAGQYFHDLAVVNLPADAPAPPAWFSDVEISPECEPAYSMIGYGMTETGELPAEPRRAEYCTVTSPHQQLGIIDATPSEGILCGGDSGGGLFLKDTTFLVGIVSARWGGPPDTGCRESTHGRFSSVTGHWDYLARAIGCWELPDWGGELDTDSPCFQRHGPADKWRSADSGGIWTFAVDSEHPENTARWLLHVRSSGRYRLSVFFPAGTSEVATYLVGTRAGTTAVPVSQLHHAGSWVELGEFELYESDLQWIALANNTGEPYSANPNLNRSLFYDRVKVEPVELWPAFLGYQCDAAQARVKQCLEGDRAVCMPPAESELWLEDTCAAVAAAPDPHACLACLSEQSCAGILPEARGGTGACSFVCGMPTFWIDNYCRPALTEAACQSERRGYYCVFQDGECRSQSALDFAAAHPDGCTSLVDACACEAVPDACRWVADEERCELQPAASSP